MAQRFYDDPILNSPYQAPSRHHVLGTDGTPLDQPPRAGRRRLDLFTPVPKNRKKTASPPQSEMVLSDNKNLSDEKQEYSATAIVNEIRQHVDSWRRLPNPAQWRVSAPTQRLLQHWRSHRFANQRPFFCQIEAVETVIWLAEVAPGGDARAKRVRAYLEAANADANPELFRIALKMATGTGKTTVMAMLIAWQTANAVRSPNAKRFSRNFLIVTPGITIKDRLRVLQPSDPDSYVRTRELVPTDMLADMAKARIVITNYHAFKPREELSVSRGTRALLKGRARDGIQTLETEGKMVRRVMGDLAGLRNVVVINDEAHHCYREKPVSEEEKIAAEEKEEAKRNAEAARLWISGLEAVKHQLGVRVVFDLSATPFFLRGSGYAEGTLFPWTVSDFSLMDAIECGIVKLPRIPVADNVVNRDVPVFRNLWDVVGTKMPKKGRGKGGAAAGPLAFPSEVYSALDTLYGHYAETFEVWRRRDVPVPPVFIVVCNNTATSELIYKYISGWLDEDEHGTSHFHQGRLELFRNYDDYGNRLTKPRTLLIDSEQLDSGEALDPGFRKAAEAEIEAFKRELAARAGAAAAETVSDETLLREVMNTVGKRGRLGEGIRCVVSVAMLTEGWDANTVTHVLGLRAFGTQLLCEQVVGRALRRWSYALDDDTGLMAPEYADIFGIPFAFMAKPVVARPEPPKDVVQVTALRERQALELRFPRVEGYRVELPNERLEAAFTDNSVLDLDPSMVGPGSVEVEGIVGEGVVMDVGHLARMRPSSIGYQLAKALLYRDFQDGDLTPKTHLFQDLRRIARAWLNGYLKCSGGTFPAQVLYPSVLEQARERIRLAITGRQSGEARIKAIVDPYNPVGSTRLVNFTTAKPLRWTTAPDKCHVNLVIGDSDWELTLAQAVERHPRVVAYVKNQGLGLEVPYRDGRTPRTYLPDFLVVIDDGRGADDLLHLIVEIKGYPTGDAQLKAETMTTLWVPGVNNLGAYGRWAFAQVTEVYEIEAGLRTLIDDVLATAGD